jgi:hypothetical protein
MSRLEDIEKSLQELSAEEREEIERQLYDRFDEVFPAYQVMEASEADLEPLYMTVEEYLEFEETSSKRRLHQRVRDIRAGQIQGDRP